MNRHIKSIYEQWLAMRECTKAFVKELSTEEKNMKIQREVLDTFNKHFEEMISVQVDFMNTFEKGKLVFETRDELISGNKATEEILYMMDEADKRLDDILSNIDIEEEIETKGGNKTVLYMLTFMVNHEVLHIGQLIAYSYMNNFEIPKLVESSWGLSG